ncbi:MAG TPA: hypothetical protein DCX07_13695 [Phycisphaerales bacterium]|nr:hypothetical protein [Phycisphaerales bacterium]
MTVRILQINKFIDLSLPAAGGPATFLSLAGRLLTERGHEVSYFGCRMGETPPELPPYVDYTRTSGPWAALRGAARIVHDARAANSLDAWLARRPADVAHVHNIYHHLTPAIFAPLRRRGVPVVMSVRDFRMICPARDLVRAGRACPGLPPREYWRCVLSGCAGSRVRTAVGAAETLVQRFFRRYVQNVHVFLCPSEFTADRLRAAGWPAHKLRVLRNPIAPPHLPADAACADDTLLYVGRLSPEKGVDLLLELADQRRDVRVVIAGDGPQRGALESAAAARGLTNVRFVGHVPHERLGRLIAECAALVLPSRCYENSPHAMLEAMAAGRCVIAPDHGPVGEWVSDGRTGRLFAPSDARDLARVAGEVLSDAAGRARMGAAAAECVRALHEPARIIDELIDIYRGAIESCESR